MCDFNLPIAADALLSRGMMGDGVIDFATIGRWVATPATPATSRWRSSTPTSGPPTPNQVLATMARRYVDLVLPSLEAALPEPEQLETANGATALVST